MRNLYVNINVRGKTMENTDLILKLVNKIYELEERIKLIEKEIEDLKSEAQSKTTNIKNGLYNYNEPSINKSQRDKTKYLFNRNIYLKNRLVLAVVTDYFKSHPSITREELKAVFDKSLQGSLGVVEFAEIAELRNDYDVRFFSKPNEALNFANGKMYVCSQWGIINIPRFLQYAKNLGYEIQEIN